MLPEAYLERKIDPSEHFENSFGMFHGDKPEQIELRFSENIAPYVKERRWHKSQRIVSNSDGTVTMYLEVSITPDLVMWLLGFGVDLRIMEPFRLREKIIQKAAQIVRLYEENAA